MNEPSPPSSGFDIVRVLLSVVAIAVVVGIGFWIYETNVNSPAAFYKVTGRVMWNDEPVTVGAVMTKFEGDPFLGALAELNEMGEFELRTNMEPGAALGRHELIVAAFGDGMPPPPLVPAEYTTFQNTPLSIEVTSDPSRNHFEIILEGELTPISRPQPPGNPDGDSNDQPMQPGEQEESTDDQGDETMN